MDVGTHALASVAVSRAILPRAPFRVVALVIAAGTLADLDSLSALSGPASYLQWHRTYTHSFVAALVLAGLIALVHALLQRRSVAGIPLPAFFLAVALAATLHLGMDACQWESIMPFWPFSSRRVDADWLPAIDPWIIVVLVAVIALPELLHLVTAEIGAKEKSPRGRAAALAGLVIVALYAGLRANQHSQALATVTARSYRGELPRRAGAFADSVSPFLWHAIVETDRALHAVDVNALSAASFDPDSGAVHYKPEPSPALERARDTSLARDFLRAARFPLAAVEQTQAASGVTVQLRDLRYAAAGGSRREVAVIIALDNQWNVLEQQAVWARDLHSR